MTPRDLMLAQYAKASDISSGGRQMPGHYGSREHHIVSVSSPVATQILHAIGIALASRIKGEDAVSVAIMGEGSSNQGDVHEGAQLRGDPQAAVHPDHREQRLRDQRPGREGAVRRRRREPGLGLRDPGRRRRRDGRPRVLRRRAGGGRAGPGRRGADAHRGQGHPAHGAQLRRPADEVPLRVGPGGGPRARPAADLPRPAARGRDPRRRDRAARCRPRSRRSSRTRPTSRSPSPTRTR